MKLVVKTLNTDPFQDDVPQLLRPYLSSYAMNKSFTIIIYNKNDLIFICRFYYLTRTMKTERAIPLDAQFELADVYMFPAYRGQGYAHDMLTLGLEYVSGPVYLWTTADNLPAIKLYQSLGFHQITSNEDWIKSKFSWMKNKQMLSFLLN